MIASLAEDLDALEDSGIGLKTTDIKRAVKQLFRATCTVTGVTVTHVLVIAEFLQRIAPSVISPESLPAFKMIFFPAISRAMNDGASKLSEYSGQHLWSVQVQEMQSKCIPELINSFLVTFRGGSSRATRLILDARVPIFEMFHSSPNTAGSMYISACTLKSEVNFSSRFFFFNKEFNDSMLTKRTIVVDHFANIACGHMIEVNDVAICKYIV
ncbi:hypothetical protein ANN_03085 [Periplaneta americana]|uniref:Uncharacterized protein n=1 Tax=Periplaneta americana TaxID=6978 RepID=A0ABQ8TY18_PERAM|nr:hypothetical protein ANN_03085 [Periplaneta americana]